MAKDIVDINIRPIIAWGAGYYFHNLKNFLKNLGVEYIYDTKWAETELKKYEDIPVIYPQEIDRLDECVIIICIYDLDVAKQLEEQLVARYKNACVYLLRDLSPIGRNISKKEILSNSTEGKYIDHCGNTLLYITESSLDNIAIRFNGEDAVVSLGENMRIVNSLYIECGNKSSVTIGKDTSFDKTIIYSAYADIEIGDDCMFSYDVYLRNHDSHFIFDKDSGKRINYGKSIDIKDHVWVGQNSILLPGFKIGAGSVVGAGSVSSSTFPDNVIIAGNSARVIRERIAWERKTTWINNYDSIEELSENMK